VVAGFAIIYIFKELIIPRDIGYDLRIFRKFLSWRKSAIEYSKSTLHQKDPSKG